MIAPTGTVEPFPPLRDASPKQRALFELMRARTTFLSAIHGLTPAMAERPIAPGKWTVREIALHLVTRDEARLRELAPVLRGAEASWRNVTDWAAINEAALAPLRANDWEAALRLLHGTRRRLLEELEGVPEEPAGVWSSDHPFGWMIGGLPPHDRHHAGQVKHWREARGA